VAEAARRPNPGSSSKVGRLASTDVIEIGGFTPGVVLAERYRIIGLLGRGGMGEVYRADDLKLGQPVALKFLPQHLASERDRLDRFYAEVRIARQVSHPNVCRVYDVGEIDGQHYLSMEYVDGEDLASLLKRIGHLPSDKALDISRELCAGLAAAHDRGVLHRDLKPSNVMIDGRGRARITDFGLAVAADAQYDGEVSGTPAYMAPEQLAGRGASVRSDLYSLGLVLYELYTGRKAFDGASLAELRRKHAEEPPTSPSALAPGLDQAVERVILRCLEKDPAARPASAAQVAAALPGGDPLAAALAAGETPSPEMVAAAGEEGALATGRARVLLACTLAGLALAVPVARFGTDLGLAPLPRSPDALEDRARELVRAAGYTDEPADRTFRWERQYEYLRYRAERIPSTRGLRELARVNPHPWWFRYRQSPRSMVPANRDGDVRSDDPPAEISGMVDLAIDARGRLMHLRAVPPQLETPARDAGPPDWTPLLAAAGLNSASLTPSVPTWLPTEPFDVRMEWDGAATSNPASPIHVVAASYRGRPVFFQVTEAWSVPTRMRAVVDSAGLIVRRLTFASMVVACLVGAVLLARRNLRLGRGDRGGAFRLAVFMLTVSLLWWLFSAHHTPDLFTETTTLFLSGLEQSVFYGMFAWLAYLAVEPVVRRRWPDLLIGWTRLLSGRVRDALVGRDVLMGVLVGALMWLALGGSNALPNWIDLPGMTPVPNATPYFAGAGAAVGRFLWDLRDSLLSTLAVMTILIAGYVLLRRKWPAMALAGLVITLLNLSGENLAVEVPAAIAIAALTMFVAVRFGILALAFAQFTKTVLSEAAPTLDLSSWYASRSAPVFVVVLALALYGFRLSLGGRSAFGRLATED
jgi:serine/threonine-protein kinase